MQPGATSAQAKHGPDSDSYEYYTDSASTSDGQNTVQGKDDEACTGTAYMLAGCVATFSCVVECAVNKQLFRHGQVAARWCRSEPREWRQARRCWGWIVRAVQGAYKLAIEMTTGSVQMDIFTVVMYLPMVLQVCVRKALQRVLGGGMGVGLRALAHGLRYFGVHLPSFLVTGLFCGLQAARVPRHNRKRGRRRKNTHSSHSGIRRRSTRQAGSSHRGQQAAGPLVIRCMLLLTCCVQPVLAVPDRDNNSQHGARHYGSKQPYIGRSGPKSGGRDHG